MKKKKIQSIRACNILDFKLFLTYMMNNQSNFSMEDYSLVCLCLVPYTILSITQLECNFLLRYQLFSSARLIDPLASHTPSSSAYHIAAALFFFCLPVSAFRLFLLPISVHPHLSITAQLSQIHQFKIQSVTSAYWF